MSVVPKRGGRYARSQIFPGFFTLEVATTSFVETTGHSQLGIPGKLNTLALNNNTLS
jgi:hypothetical protein